MTTETDTEESPATDTVAEQDTDKEELDTTEEPSPDGELSEADAEAAMEAGFEQAMSGIEDEPPPAPEKSETASGDDDDVSDPETDPDGGAGSEPKDDGDDTPASADEERFTKAEVQALIDSALADQNEQIRKLNGKFGELNSKVGASGGKTNFTKEDFAALGEDYEDMAELLAKDLSGKLGAAQGIDMEQLLPQVQEALEETITAREKARSDEFNEGFLNHFSHGWQAKLESDEYGNWLGELPPEEQERVVSTENVFEVMRDLETFDAWQTKKTEAAAAAAAEAEKAKKAAADKQRRLEGAVPATTGGGSPTPTNQPDDALSQMEAGFNAA